MSAGPGAACSWTQIGQRLGITSHPAQRALILSAITDLDWSDLPARPAWLQHPAVRSVLAAIFHNRPDQLRRVSAVELGDGRRLIGLQDSLGTRSYLIEQDTPGSGGWLTEAVHVLNEYPWPLRRHADVA